MMSKQTDAIVLAKMREFGPGTITVKELARLTGLPRITVRTAVSILGSEGLVCLMADITETTYMIRHLHAEPGECDQPLACSIQEVHPDGQR